MTITILRWSLLCAAIGFCLSQVSHLPMFDQTCCNYGLVEVEASAITRIAGVVFLASGFYYLVVTEALSGFLKITGVCVVMAALATSGWVLVKKIDMNRSVSEALDDPGRLLEILDAVNTDKIRPSEELSDISHSTAEQLYVQHGMIVDVLLQDRSKTTFVPTAEQQHRRSEWMTHRGWREINLLWYHVELLLFVVLIASSSVLAIRHRRGSYPSAKQTL